MRTGHGSGGASGPFHHPGVLVAKNVSHFAGFPADVDLEPHPAGIRPAWSEVPSCWPRVTDLLDRLLEVERVVGGAAPRVASAALRLRSPRLDPPVAGCLARSLHHRVSSMISSTATRCKTSGAVRPLMDWTTRTTGACPPIARAPVAAPSEDGVGVLGESSVAERWPGPALDHRQGTPTRRGRGLGVERHVGPGEPARAPEGGPLCRPSRAWRCR